MAKDPAFLFYSQDFYTGVATLNWEERGKFISILCLMHQQGRMSEETIRFLVGSVSVNLKSKFKVDENGLWFNERLEAETAKRNNYTESRRLNGLSGGRPSKTKPYAKAKRNHKQNHKVNLMEDENVIENEDKNKSVGKDFSKPDINGDEIHFPTDSKKIRSAWATWKEYRFKEHNKTYSMFGEQAALKQLEGMDEASTIATIWKAIESNWLNLYPDRNGKSNGKINGNRKEQSDASTKASVEQYYRDKLKERGIQFPVS